MAKLRFPAPMTCEQARGLFPALLSDTLNAEPRGRVEGHLLACEACSVVFVEEIEHAMTRGDVTQPEVPPLPAVVTIALPAAAEHMAGRGVVAGWLWEVLHREGKPALEREQRPAAWLDQALTEAFRRATEHRREQVQARLEGLERCLQAS